MRANREILGQHLPIKTKNEYVCRKIGKKTPRQLIVEAGVKFMHKVVNSQLPHEIYEQIIFPRKFRKNAKITLKRIPRTAKCRRCLIYKATRMFNELHSSLKFIHPKVFKRLIEKRKILEIPDD